MWLVGKAEQSTPNICLGSFVMKRNPVLSSKYRASFYLLIYFYIRIAMGILKNVRNILCHAHVVWHATFVKHIMSHSRLLCATHRFSILFSLALWSEKRVASDHDFDVQGLDPFFLVQDFRIGCVHIANQHRIVDSQ